MKNLITKKSILLMVVIMTINVAVFAQSGEYTRSSISSLDSVWIQRDVLNKFHEGFNYEMFDKFMTFYVESPRFDYNRLSSEDTQSFRDEASRLSEITPEALSSVLENTVVKKIREVLNDPEVQAARASEFKSEADAKSFAATKAKSLGLTEEGLGALLNSAYIYLPFISEIETTNDGDFFISGGIFWWKINTDENGKSDITMINESTTLAVAFGPGSEYLHKTTIFHFGSEQWVTNGLQSTQYDAMLTLAKNLGVKTKAIDAFKLSAQITEIKRNGSYGFELGKKEGVHLDDGFFIVEYEENAVGKEVAVKKGFVRITKTGNNTANSEINSYAKHLIGSKVGEGAIVMEHSRLGMDLRIGVEGIIGSKIAPAQTFNMTDGSIENIVGGSLAILYNMAPITGTSQTFLTLDLGFGLLKGDLIINNAAIFSPYLGLSRYWGGRLYAGLAGSIGIDSFNIMESENDNSLSLMSLGAKVEVEAGFMLNADIKMYLNVGYKLGLKPITYSKTIDGVDEEGYIAENNTLNNLYDGYSLGGLKIGAGFSYSLGELPINLFGFLDPLKKY